jgi:hypothetical protein
LPSLNEAAASRALARYGVAFVQPEQVVTVRLKQFPGVRTE